MAQFIGSTTPLAGSASFTSKTVTIDWAQYVSGSVYSDQSGTFNIEFSGDGVNFDAVYSISVVGGTGQGFAQQIILPYVRFVYVNGSSDQTAFRLFSSFNTYSMP
jgi:hypothetical protein